MEATTSPPTQVGEETILGPILYQYQPDRGWSLLRKDQETSTPDQPILTNNCLNGFISRLDIIEYRLCEFENRLIQMFTREVHLRLSISGCLLKAGSHRHSMSRAYQNSRLQEGKQVFCINYTVCINTLDTTRYSY